MKHEAGCLFGGRHRYLFELTHGGESCEEASQRVGAEGVPLPLGWDFKYVRDEGPGNITVTSITPPIGGRYLANAHHIHAVDGVLGTCSLFGAGGSPEEAIAGLQVTVFNHTWSHNWLAMEESVAYRDAAPPR